MDLQKLENRIVKKVVAADKAGIPVSSTGVGIDPGKDGVVVYDGRNQVCGMGALLLGTSNKHLVNHYDTDRYRTTVYSRAVASLLSISIDKAGALERGFMHGAYYPSVDTSHPDFYEVGANAAKRCRESGVKVGR